MLLELVGFAAFSLLKSRISNEFLAVESSQRSATTVRVCALLCVSDAAGRGQLFPSGTQGHDL